jgi:hypothetical protein
MARDNRRRRVLNEEARSASGLNLATFAGGAADADAPRYGEQANVEHHPQVTDYIPRRKRAVIVTLLAGLSTAAGAEALVHFADSVAAAIPGTTAVEFSGRIASGAVAWASAIILLLCAALAKLIYSLRRHRVNDYAGRYRVWRWIVWGAVLSSINSVIQIQDVIARIAVAASGKSLTATGAEWWIAPLALVGGWIFIRLVLEIAESRLSLVVMLLAAACYVTAAAAALGWSPATLGAWSDSLTFALPLVGHTIALAGLMIFARYVVLDVQGLIEHKPRPAKVRTDKTAGAAAAVKLAASTAAGNPVPSGARPTAEAKPSSSAASPSSDEDDEDGDAAGRKLSKAERKRLRRQHRAA